MAVVPEPSCNVAVTVPRPEAGVLIENCPIMLVEVEADTLRPRLMFCIDGLLTSLSVPDRLTTRPVT